MTAYRALFHRAQARPGETVLVHGASGGVGIGCVELAHARGLIVIGTAGTDKGLALVREHGADIAINHRDADAAEQIWRRPAAAASTSSSRWPRNVNLDRDLTMLAKFGRIVLVGNKGRVEIDPRQAMGRDAAILGMTLFNVDEESRREIHAGLIAGLENGSLNPVISRSIPLAEAASAHVAVMEPGAHGKIVLIP